MTETAEFLMVTYQSNQNCSACIWNYNTGNIESLYKNGGPVSAKTLCQIGNDYVLTAEKEKPLLHVWPSNSQEQIKNVRFILPEPANAVSVDPTNSYVAVGINLKMYVWHLSSGILLNVVQKHYMSITCVKFSDTGEYLVTAGQDGMLMTYKFSDVINSQNNNLAQSEIGQCEPLYSRIDNSCPIADLHLGNFGSKSRLTTVSADHTCRIYDLHFGQLLLTLVFDVGLSAVALDAPCWNLFVGSNEGSITQVYLKDPPRTLEQHIDSDQAELKFVGHQKKITCLSLSMSNKILASGSEDNSFIIWEAKSRNILRKIEKGIITNVMFIQNHVNIHIQVLKPRTVLKPLQRSLDTDLAQYAVSVIHEEDVTFDDEEVESKRSGNEDLEAELINIKMINRQLYNTIIKVSRKYNAIE